MAPIYLFDLYQLIDEQLELIETEITNTNGQLLNYLEGKRDALNEFRSYLSEQYDQKLPKRLRKKL